MDKRLKILVTGANGYLGRGITEHLLDSGVDVVATDFATDGVDSRAIRIPCNLFEVPDPFAFFAQPDVLLHLAWRDGFVHYSNAHIDDLPKHFAFLERMADSPVKTLAAMGSMHEIGFFEGSIKEDTPCNPITPYGIGKNALRMLLQMLCKQKRKRFLWLRGYYIVGNTRHGSSIFSKLVAAAMDGQSEFPFTMGQNQFDFTDYPDFCEMTAQAILQMKWDGIINICSGHPEKLADRVERFIAENHFPIRLAYGAFPDRPYDSKAVWGDGRKIADILQLSRQCHQGP